MNKVILSGNISTDINFKTTNNGAPVARFNLAVNRKEETDFIPITVWNQTAENVNEYCEKGSKLLVEGRLQIRDYEVDGQKKYSTEVVADRVEFMSSKKNPYKDMSIKTEFEIGKQLEITDDDMPF